MARKYDLELRAKQEPLLEYWLEAFSQFFGGFSPEILKCITLQTTEDDPALVDAGS